MKQDDQILAADNLMEGAFDLHIHPAPSHVTRVLDDVGVFQRASAYQMGGVALKCHYEPTGARARLLNSRGGSGQTQAIGSISLNWPVGGLNPYAVESACKMGARIIWMPTRDSSRSLEFGDMPGDFFKRPGITVLGEDGKLLPVVYEILEIARKYGVPTATGHLSVEESVALCEAGRGMGNKMILTHPEWHRTMVPLPIQKQLAGQGVLIEKCWLNIVEGDVSEQTMFHTIEQLGVSTVFISTDSGKPSVMEPIASYRDMLLRMLRWGFKEDEIRKMACSNPKALITQ